MRFAQLPAGTGFPFQALALYYAHHRISPEHCHSSHIPDPYAVADDADLADEGPSASSRDAAGEAFRESTADETGDRTRAKPDDSETATAAPVPDDKWLKQLFRRAAQALHPDRERDPDQLAHKEQLMTELLQARDNNDLMAVMTLYQQHVATAELQIPGVLDELRSLKDLKRELQYRQQDRY